MGICSAMQVALIVKFGWKIERIILPQLADITKAKVY